MVTNQRISYISYIRVFATLLVVFFHSYCPYIHSIGLSYECPQVGLYKSFFLIEERIQMPLFTFLSSFLFGLTFNRKYKNTTVVIRKKIKRLLVPYVILGVLMYITLPSNHQASINFIDHIEHLWFLLFLFWCFVLQMILWLFHIRPTLQLAISVIMLLVSKQLLPILCIDALFQLFVFFNIGFHISNQNFNLDRIRDVVLIPIIIICSILILVFHDSWNANMIMKLLRIIVYFLTSIGYLIFIFKVAMRLCANKQPSKLLFLLDTNSMGIYVFHYWIMLNLLELAFMKKIVVNYPFLYPICAFIFLSVSSFFLSYIVRKSKYGKQLI